MRKKIEDGDTTAARNSNFTRLNIRNLPDSTGMCQEARRTAGELQSRILLAAGGSQRFLQAVFLQTVFLQEKTVGCRLRLGLRNDSSIILVAAGSPPHP